MNLSYWELDSWFKNVDYTIVGSGIVGLNTALAIKQVFPEAKVLILERGMLPNGASTKNAGFATFGSVSEILSDLTHHSEEDVLGLVEKRLNGLEMLRKNLGDKFIGYLQYGGTELFVEAQAELYEKCLKQRDRINRLLLPLFKDAEVFQLRRNSFGFKKILSQCIYTPYEGQLHTGMMMSALLQKVLGTGVKILNNSPLEEFVEGGDKVFLKTDRYEFATENLLITTNGFASQLGISEVKPARAQVLITEPIKNLSLKGTFHLEEGFYYFRNIGDRILLGGGRNLDFKTEETTVMAQTELIQNKLDQLLREVILPEKELSVAHRWSGIMGVGEKKKPIVKRVSARVYCGVRLGGMGVAIGSMVGKDLAELVMRRH